MLDSVVSFILFSIPIVVLGYISYIILKLIIKRAIKESSDELKKMMREVAKETIDKYEWDKHIEKKKNESKKA